MLEKRIFTAIFYLIILFFSEGAFAQSVPTVGKTFWLGFMQNNSIDASDSLKIFVSSAVNTTGKVSIPNQGYEVFFTVQANVPKAINIANSMAEHYGSEIAEQKGILVETADSVAVYASNFQLLSADAARILPVGSLGTRYRVISYFGSPGWPSEFLIVATENGTKIKIRPTVNTVQHQANQLFTINLNKGESYQVKASGYGDLTGTLIEATDSSGSCRPFAVFGGNVCANVPTSCGNCDHIFDQNFPINAWGSNYLLVPFKNTTSYTFRVMAEYNNTWVYINGGLPFALSQGQILERNFQDQPVSITSNQPIQVVQFMQGGYTCGNTGISDPAMCVLTPTEQSIKQVSFSTINSSALSKHSLNLVISTSDIGLAKLDGVTINPNLFNQFVGRPQYSYATIDISPAVHQVSAPNGLAGVCYGAGVRLSYAFSLAAINNKPSIIDSVFCSADTVTLKAPINLSTTNWVRASKPDSILSNLSVFKVFPHTTDLYWVQGSSSVSGCNQVTKYMVERSVPPQLSISTNSDTVCKYSDLNLSVIASPASAYYNYRFTPVHSIVSSNKNSAIFSPTKSGYFGVTVSTPSGCAQSSDSAFIVVRNGATQQFNVWGKFGDSSRVCQGDSAYFNLEYQKILINDNFELSSVNSLLWDTISGGAISSGCNNGLGSKGLWFTLGGSRMASTKGLNLIKGGSVSFILYFPETNGICDGADLGQDVLLEYSIDNGQTYKLIRSFITSDYAVARLEIIELPTDAATTNTRLRIRQITNGGSNLDIWAIDNFTIFSNENNGNFNWKVPGQIPIADGSQLGVKANISGWVLALFTDTTNQCLYADSVYLEVGTPFTIATTPDTLMCSSAGVTLRAIPNGGTNHTISWMPQSFLSNTQSLTPIANPPQTTQYRAIVQSYQGCSDTGYITLNVVVPFDISLVAQKSNICKGDTAKITAKVLNACGPYYGSLSVADTATIGVGTAYTSSPVVNPFPTNTIVRRQIIYTQSELSSMGITGPSIIYSLGFVLENVGSSSELNNFQVKMECIGQQSFATDSFLTVNTVVYSPKTYNPVSGVSFINFDVPYFYSGSEGLIIEICYSNATTTTQRKVWYSNLGTGIQRNLYVSTNATCNSEIGIRNTNRPVSVFSYRNLQQSDLVYNFVWNKPVVSSLADTFAFQLVNSGNVGLTVTNSDGCSNFKTVPITVSDPQFSLGPDVTFCQGDSVLVSANNPLLNYIWNDGLTSPSRYIKSAGTYTVVGSVGASCLHADTILVLASPLPFVILPNDTVVCNSIIVKPKQVSPLVQWLTWYRNDSLIATTSDSIVLNKYAKVKLQVTDGCGFSAFDSAIINVQNIAITPIAAKLCNGDSLLFGGKYINNAGIYFDTLVSAAGCDSVIKLLVDTIRVLSQVYFVPNSPLPKYSITDTTKGQVQWYNCTTGQTLGQAFTQPYISQPVKAVLTVDGCTDTSACFIEPLSGNKKANDQKISLWPNPAINILHVNIGQSSQNGVMVSIISANGTIKHSDVYYKQQIEIDISLLPAGFYFIKSEELNTHSVYESYFIKAK